MKEKENIKISLFTLLLIIAIIIILIMGYFLYKLNNKNTNMISNQNSLNAQITELDNKVANKNETQTSQKTFSEIMDMLYTKNGAKIGENDYIITPSDSVSMTYEDASGDIANIEYTDVRIIDGEIDFYINKIEPDKYIYMH